MSSIFMEKSHMPTNENLQKVLGERYVQWNTIREYTLQQYPKALEEWNFPGTKYGWSFRMKDKKRAIVYLLPRDKYFTVALVYGQKATDEAVTSSISNEIKEIIKSAPVYAEGRGFRIDIQSEDMMEDIKKLIDIKLAN